MSEIAPKKKLSPIEKAAQLIRLFGSPIEGEAHAAFEALLRLLGPSGIDVHVLAERIVREPLSDAEMQKIYDVGFKEGLTQGTEQGRRQAVAAAQPVVLEPGVPIDVNGYGWAEIAQHCLDNLHLFQGRDQEFIESISEQLARWGNGPTPKQAKWLKDLFVRKLGGRIE
jgi:hypothetical protein